MNSNDLAREVDDKMAFNLNKGSTLGLELYLSLYPAKGLFINMSGLYLFRAEE